MSQRNLAPKCPKCGGKMKRDWSSLATVNVVGDPETTGDDVARYCRQKADGQEVSRATLSRSMARIPGIPKITGPDGKRYAYFESKAHRRRVMKQVGLVDLD